MAKKKKQEDPPQGSPPWMTSFADMMTVVMAFFVLMFAMSGEFDEEVFARLMASFGNPHFTHVPSTPSVILPGSGISMGSGIIQMPVPHSNRFDGEGQTMNNDEIQMAMNAMVTDFQTYLLESQNALAQQVEVLLVDDVLTINFPDNMLFAVGSDTVLPQVIEIIDYIATVIYQHPLMFIHVHGHTDSSPINTLRFPNNYWLGFGRAHAVHNRLVEQGISTHRIQAISHGDTQPIASNETPEGRQANRRVEIVITPTP